MANEERENQMTNTTVTDGVRPTPFPNVSSTALTRVVKREGARPPTALVGGQASISGGGLGLAVVRGVRIAGQGSVAWLPGRWRTPKHKRRHQRLPAALITHFRCRRPERVRSSVGPVELLRFGKLDADELMDEFLEVVLVKPGKIRVLRSVRLALALRPAFASLSCGSRHLPDLSPRS
jgi:hypothetical protein